MAGISEVLRELVQRIAVVGPTLAARCKSHCWFLHPTRQVTAATTLGSMSAGSPPRLEPRVPCNARLLPEQVEQIDRLAVAWRCRRSDVIRRAVLQFLAQQSTDKETVPCP